jgi:hypothetical protein
MNANDASRDARVLSSSRLGSLSGEPLDIREQARFVPGIRVDSRELAVCLLNFNRAGGWAAESDEMTGLTGCTG